jgi:hypothetical protein
MNLFLSNNKSTWSVKIKNVESTGIRVKYDGQIKLSSIKVVQQTIINKLSSTIKDLIFFVNLFTKKEEKINAKPPIVISQVREGNM